MDGAKFFHDIAMSCFDGYKVAVAEGRYDIAAAALPLVEYFEQKAVDLCPGLDWQTGMVYADSLKSIQALRASLHAKISGVDTPKAYYGTEHKASGYLELNGPNGEVCTLTEPEDIRWTRDLAPILDELNKLHDELTQFRKEKQS